MSQTDNRIFLTIEAYSSGPIKVTVVRSPNGEGDFFFVEDSQLSDTSNSNRCPTYDLPSKSAEVEIAKDSEILLSQYTTRHHRLSYKFFYKGTHTLA